MALKIIGLLTVANLQLYLILGAPIDQFTIPIQNEETHWQVRDLDPKNSDLASVMWPFLKSAVSRLKEIPNSEDELKSALDDIEQAFPDKDDILGALLRMAKKFLDGGYYLSPETARDIITKAVRHSQKEPDTLLNNATKLTYKTMKAVGNAIENGGDLIATGVKTVKDLQNTQAPITNSVAQYVPIPYLGKVVQALNSAISNTLEVLQLSAKFTLRAGGRTVSKVAEDQKLALKEKKQRAQEEKKQTEEAAAANPEAEKSKKEDDEGKKKKGEKKAKKKKTEATDDGDA